MGRISSGVGLVSGIDHRAIIDQLMALEARPKDQLQTRIENTNERKLAYTDLSTRLMSLKLTGTALKKPSSFQASTTTTNNEDVLTATATNGAAIGNYQFQVARLVSTQQAVTGGFADTTTAKVGAGEITIEMGGGELTNPTMLSQLNGGAGVRRGSFRITDRSGASAVIDTAGAVTVDDVMKKINTALGVTVRASAAGDKLVLTDLTGKTLSNLSVADLGGGSAGADLGLVADVAANAIGGADIHSVGAGSLLDELNDGLGVRRSAGSVDFTITVGDGTAIDITLGAARSIGDVINIINTAGGTKLKAEVLPGANGITLTDTSGGGGAFGVAAQNGSMAAADLGIEAAGTGGVITGGDLVAGINTVSLASLRGGTGIPLGQITVTDRGGQTATVDLSAAKTVQDVIDAISNAPGVRLTASLKASGNGIQITDDSGGAGDLIIADANAGTTAAVLGIAGTFSAATPAVQGANLQRQWVTENQMLASYNGGKGVGKGKFKITNGAGETATIDLSPESVVRLGDVIREINARAINVTASINANGDGLLLTDTSGGAGKMKVDDIDSTAAADLRIKGVAAVDTIDGSFERTLTVDAADTLTSVQLKLQEMNFGVNATLLNDGSGATPHRLSLTAKNSGRTGRVVIDGGATQLQTANLVEAQDAAVFYGAAEGGGQPLLVTSSRNQITGVINGVTLDLHGTSDRPVSVSVVRSADALVEQLTKFAESFNETADKLKELTKFDTDANKRGLLLGESTVQTIETHIFAMFSGVVTTAGKFRVPGDVGLKLVNGQLEFDEDKFRDAFASDPDALQKLFTTSNTGLTSTTPLSQLNAGRGVRTAAGGMADFRVTTKDGSTVDVTLGSVSTIGEVIATINAAGGANFRAEIAADGNSLKLTDTSPAGAGTFALTALNGSVAATDLKLTSAAADGVISGQKILDPSRQLSLAAGTGLGYLIENSMSRLIDPVDGAISRENKTLEEKTMQFQGRIDSLDKSLTAKRERLERQFSQMESVLANLQNQQSSLASLQSLQFNQPSRNR